MNRELDVDSILDNWFTEGPTNLPNHALEAIVQTIQHSSQRRSWWQPGRETINRFMIAAGSLAAVALVAVIGIGLASGGGIFGLGASPSPAPVQTLGSTSCTELEAGAFRSAVGPIAITVTVPRGWHAHQTTWFNVATGECGLDHGPDTKGLELTVSRVSQVYADACHWAGTAVRTGSPAAVVAALAAQTGHATTGPTNESMAGYPAARFEISVPPEGTPADQCEGSSQVLLGQSPEGPVVGALVPGETVTVYVVDADGQALIVIPRRGDTSTPGDVTELDAVVASMRIAP